MSGAHYFSCGHTDTIREDLGWPLKIKDYDCDAVDGYHKCITYSTVCLDCYKTALEEYPELIIFEKWEEEEYFNGS